MKYQLDKKGIETTVEVSVQGEQQTQLLEAFEACKSGTCGCPTDEYQKLEGMDIKQGEGSISLSLKPKEGEELDQAEIKKCLDYTARQIDK